MPNTNNINLSLPLFRQLFNELINAGRDMRDRDRLGLFYLPEDEYFENVVKRYSNNILYKILDKDGTELPDDWAMTPRTYKNVKRLCDTLNINGEYKPYTIIPK
jgi:hypothetical protein